MPGRWMSRPRLPDDYATNVLANAIGRLQSRWNSAWAAGGYRLLFCYPPGFPYMSLAASGQIELKFPPVIEPKNMSAGGWPGTAAVFVRFVSDPNPSPTPVLPLSDAYGLLLDVGTDRRMM